MKYCTKRFAAVFIIFSIYYLFVFNIPVYAETNTRKNILILNSSNSFNNLDDGNMSINWTNEIIAGITSELKERRIKAKVSVQYMDSTSDFSDSYYDMLYNLYKYKYSNTKFDILVAVEDNAFNFLLKYGNDLFPDTPVVFCAVKEFNKSKIDKYPLFTGTFKNQDIKSTVEIALKLHPNVKEVFGIFDKTSNGLMNIDMFKELDHLYKNRVKFSYCDDEDINIIKQKIDILPKDTIILASTKFNDITQRNISTAEACKIIFRDSVLPVYSTGYAYLNNGIVGGMLTNGTSYGIDVGKMVLRILNGEKPSNIPVTKELSHRYIFDFNQLKRFNINISELPKDSVIINRPSPIYSFSKQLLLKTTIVIIFSLTVIIIYLIISIYRRKIAEKLLFESEDLLKTLINSTPDVICFKSPDGELLEANTSMLDFFSIKERYYRHKTISQLANAHALEKKDIAIFEECDKKAWENGSIYRTEETLHYEKEDTIKVYDIIRIPLFNKDGSRRGLVLSGRDITEQKANEENKKIIDELVYYDKLRMEFFTNLSHELRTPLNIIFSSLQVIEVKMNNGDNIKTEITKYKDIMKQNCYRLIRIINNIMDISKIDSGNFSVHLENLNIISLVEDITLSVADYIESNGISITFDTEVEEQIIACDPNAIERIILNLLSNAVKFTPTGGSITIYIVHKNDNILISVKDTGIGIPIEKQEAVFGRFIQVDKSLSRNREGSGLGLSLVKALIELHKGTITLISKPNHGSEFIITLPGKPLNDSEVKLGTYNLYENKNEKIRMEFSDIYG